MVAWFLGLEDVLSWLLVERKRDAIIVDINSIALFRQAIGSSPDRNDGTASPENQVNTYAIKNTKLLSVLKIVIMDPVMQSQPSPATQGRKDSCFKTHGDYTHFYDYHTNSKIIDIEKVALSSSLQSLKLNVHY
ncbi:hypothetical protein Tco_1008374 [Tanacetum coccineum]